MNEMQKWLASLPRMVHDPRCSGCPFCKDEYAALMRMSHADRQAWNRAKTCALYRRMGRGRECPFGDDVHEKEGKHMAKKTEAIPPPKTMAQIFRKADEGLTPEQVALGERWKAAARKRAEKIGR